MNTETFMKVAKERLKKCTDLLEGTKDKEYTRNGDKFHNFKRAAAISGESPERALKGMWMKHIVSVFDMIDDLDKGTYPAYHSLDAKFTDNINYLLLLEGLIIERIQIRDFKSQTGFVFEEVPEKNHSHA